MKQAKKKQIAEKKPAAKPVKTKGMEKSAAASPVLFKSAKSIIFTRKKIVVEGGKNPNGKPKRKYIEPSEENVRAARKEIDRRAGRIKFDLK